MFMTKMMLVDGVGDIYLSIHLSAMSTDSSLGLVDRQSQQATLSEEFYYGSQA